MVLTALVMSPMPGMAPLPASKKKCCPWWRCSTMRPAAGLTELPAADGYVATAGIAAACTLRGWLGM